MLKMRVALVCCVLAALIAQAQKPPNTDFIYLSLENSVHQNTRAFNAVPSTTDGLLDKDHVANLGFGRYMPAVGIGYLARTRLMFLQLNLSYRYADKRVAVHSDHYSFYLDKQTVYSASSVEDLHGLLTLHYINSDIKFGISPNRFIALSLGLRRSFVGGWKFEGSYEKTIVSTDTYMKTNSTRERYFFGKYHNKEAIKESEQSIRGQNFALICLTTFFKFGGRSGFAEACGQIPFQLNNGSYFLNLTLGISLVEPSADTDLNQP